MGRIGALLSLVAFGVGCSLAEPYPTPVQEDCTNARDDDLDGLADCDDPNCDGRCPEETAAQCANGRDDDGDLHPDLSDPRCWAFAGIRLTACPTVPASDTTYAPALNSGRDGWTGDSTAVLSVPDPVHAGRTVLGLAPTLTGAVIRDLRSQPGLWRGTTLTARIYVSGPNTRISVYLGAAAEIQLSTDLGLSITAEDQFVNTSDAIVGGWWQLSVTIGAADGGHVHIDATAIAETTHRTVTTGLDSMLAWPPGGDMQLSVDFLVLTSAGAAALLDTVHLVRPGGRWCSAGPPSLRGEVVSIAGDESMGCATGSDWQHSWMPQAWRSAHGSFSAPQPITYALGAPIAAWSPQRAVFRGIAPRSDGTLALVESTDCVAWRELGDALAQVPMDLPILSDGLGWSASYLIDPVTDAHEVWIATQESPTEPTLLVVASPSGDPGTFTATRRVGLSPQGAVLDPLNWRAHAHVARVGDDHVLLLGVNQAGAQPGDSRAISQMLVESADGWREVRLPESNALPSVAAGLLMERSFDATHFTAWLFQFDEHLNGNPGDVISTAVAELEIAAPGSCRLNDELCNQRDDDCDGRVDEGC